jgi:hypothetical protein
MLLAEKVRARPCLIDFLVSNVLTKFLLVMTQYISLAFTYARVFGVVKVLAKFCCPKNP